MESTWLKNNQKSVKIFQKSSQNHCLGVGLAVWERLGGSWGVFEHLAGVLGASWGVLGPSWGRLGSVFGSLGGVLGRLSLRGFLQTRKCKILMIIRILFFIFSVMPAPKYSIDFFRCQGRHKLVKPCLRRWPERCQESVPSAPRGAPLGGPRCAQ